VFDSVIINGLASGIATLVTVGLIALLTKVAGGGIRTGPGEAVLRYGAGLRAIGLVCVVAVVITLILLAIGQWVVGNPRVWIGAAILAGVFILPGVPLLMEGYRRQITLTDGGISARGWFGPVGQLRWDEVEKVENRAEYGKLIVRGRGKKITISHYLDGLEVFVAECVKRLRPEVYGKAFGKLNPPGGGKTA
jgi:hypothetical protein